jgi:hypothetical protein
VRLGKRSSLPDLRYGRRSRCSCWASFGLAECFVGIAAQSGAGLGHKFRATALMRSPASVMMFSRMSVSSRTPVSRSMSSAVDWRNDGLCSICLAARSAPSVGLLFLAGVIGNNTASMEWKSKEDAGADLVEVARLGALLLVVDGDVVHFLALWVGELWADGSAASS